MNVRIKQRFTLIGLCLLLVALLVPSVALAKSYRIDSVNMNAVIQPDGSMIVEETRTFDFNGSFKGVYWDDKLRPDQSLELIEAGEVKPDGTFVPYKPTEFTKDYPAETYFFDADKGREWRLEVYFRKSDEKVPIRIKYKVVNAVVAHADVAELYWKFVGPAWAEDSRNVTLTVHLPEHSEKLVPGKNVHAWGHGQLSGEVHFKGDDIVYTLPRVRAGNFAEARILFPLSLVNQMTPGTDKAYQEILAEEQANADRTNAERKKARAAFYTRAGIATGVTVVFAVIVFLLWSRYGKDYKPTFDGKYFRDVPSDDHPAILGYIWDEKIQGPEFSATVLRLVDLGYLKMEKVQTEEKGFFGSRVEDDYIIAYSHPEPISSIPDPIDRAALNFLFKTVGKNKRSFRTSELKSYAKDHAETYMNYYENWRNEILETAERKGYFEEKGKYLRFVGILGIVASLILQVLFGPLRHLDIPHMKAMAAVSVIALVITIVCTIFMQRRSRPAEETLAKLTALKNWFKDFTLLKEAPPTHVLVWKQLLVIATVLGVSKEVIEKLHATLPQVYEDPEMMPMILMLDNGSGYSPLGSFDNSFSAARSAIAAAAAADLASSSMSSGSGSGGGFSGGGGGGFGGGGGGAF